MTSTVCPVPAATAAAGPECCALACDVDRRQMPVQKKLRRVPFFSMCSSPNPHAFNLSPEGLI